jgi:thiamine biosynthesis lipoprotein
MKEFAYETKAMGSEVSLSFVTDKEQDALNAKDDALKVISQYELCFSRFITDSELSLLNTNKKSIVTEKFYEIFTCAIQLSVQTGGAFNPLLHIASLGYTKTFQDIEEVTQHPEQKSYDIDITKIQTNPKNRSIQLTTNQNLDFGGILKGFLSEKIARDIEKKYTEFQGVIINLGGDLHTRGVDEDGDIFIFNIYNPVTKQEHEIALRNQSLATSGTYKRSWITSEGVYNHILDTSGTKNPKNSILSASVVGTNGSVCEAYTKVLINKPLKEAVQLLQKEKLQYLAVDSNGKTTTNL